MTGIVDNGGRFTDNGGSSIENDIEETVDYGKLSKKELLSEIERYKRLNSDIVDSIDIITGNIESLKEQNTIILQNIEATNRDVKYEAECITHKNMIEEEHKTAIDRLSAIKKEQADKLRNLKESLERVNNIEIPTVTNELKDLENRVTSYYRYGLNVAMDCTEYYNKIYTQMRNLKVYQCDKLHIWNTVLSLYNNDLKYIKDIIVELDNYKKYVEDFKLGFDKGVNLINRTDGVTYYRAFGGCSNWDSLRKIRNDLKPLFDKMKDNKTHILYSICDLIDNSKEPIPFVNQDKIDKKRVDDFYNHIQWNLDRNCFSSFFGSKDWFLAWKSSCQGSGCPTSSYGERERTYNDIKYLLDVINKYKNIYIKYQNKKSEEISALMNEFYNSIIETQPFRDILESDKNVVKSEFDKVEYLKSSRSAYGTSGYGTSGYGTSAYSMSSLEDKYYTIENVCFIIALVLFIMLIVILVVGSIYNTKLYKLTYGQVERAHVIREQV